MPLAPRQQRQSDVSSSNIAPRRTFGGPAVRAGGGHAEAPRFFVARLSPGFAIRGPHGAALVWCRPRRKNGGHSILVARVAGVARVALPNEEVPRPATRDPRPSP